MNYKETLDLLYNLMPDFSDAGADAYKPGLERVERFMKVLGNPHKDFHVIHIAGTNGKGSVSHILASVLTAAGCRTGLYTSPHLRDFRERIKVDGEMIPERQVVAFSEQYFDTFRETGLSFFEATVGMAFDYFRDQGVEVAVVETGLGGRLDATNIVMPVLSVITNIGMDHMSFLGDTIEAIAAEKAGIIKPRIPVLIGERDDRITPVFEKMSAEKRAPLFFAEDMFREKGCRREGHAAEYEMESLDNGETFRLRLDLSGSYQQRNVVTALGALKILNKFSPASISLRAIREGFASAAASTGLRGRWEILGYDPLVVADTGHNAHAFRLLTEQLAGEKYDRLYMVLGFVADKDLSEILPLLPKNARYIFTQPSVGRALPAGELAQLAAGYGLEGEAIGNVSDAVSLARELAGPGDMIFIGGSTFVVADLSYV